MSQQRLIMLVFFVQALTFGSWLPRIPEVQQALGVDHAGLALGLIGLPVGTLMSLPIAGRLATRLGARKIIIIGFVLFLAAVTLPGWATSLPMFFVALMLTGAFMSLLELGLNIKADEIEKGSDKLIMSTCHGFWSLGLMVGTLVSAGFIAIGLAPGLSQLIFALLVLPLALFSGVSLQEAETPEQPAAPAEKPKRFQLPHPTLLGICVFVVGTTLTEGAAADWSAIFMRDMFDAPAALIGFGYTLFALMITTGRFMGDRLKLRYGAANLGRVCGLIGVAGGLVVVVSPSIPFALMGFAMLGFGASVGFPLAVTAAAEAPGISPARNVAVLTFIALTGFLAGPPVIGFISEAFNLRIGLAVLVPALLTTATLAGLLKTRGKPIIHPVDAPII